MFKSLVGAACAAAMLGGAAASAQVIPAYYPADRSVGSWDRIDSRNGGFGGLEAAEGIRAVVETTDTTVTVSTSFLPLRGGPHHIQIQTLCSDGEWKIGNAFDTIGFTFTTECAVGTIIEKSDVMIAVGDEV